MKVYSVNKYNCTKVEEKEVTRTTDASIFFLNHKGKEVSERKETNYVRWFDTLEEAVTHRIQIFERNIESYNTQIAETKSNIDKLKELLK